jgi:hypothetical protein
MSERGPDLSRGQEGRRSMIELQDMTRAMAQQVHRRRQDVPPLSPVRPEHAF